MTAKTNPAAMLEQFAKLLADAGYVPDTGRRRHRVQAIAALLADARLFCELHGISWRKAVDQAKDQVLHDLDELAWMAKEHINLRTVSHESFVDQH